MAKHDKTGRSKSSGRFVRLEHWILNTPAWRGLSTNARAAWIELAALYNGTNNGRIALGVFTLGERLGLSKSSASRALNELEEAGFIRTEKMGSYKSHTRQACEYRLTHLPDDVGHRPPTKEFTSVGSAKAEKPFPPVGMTGAPVGTDTTIQTKIEPKRPRKIADGVTGETVEQSHGATGGNHIVYHCRAGSEIASDFPELPPCLDRRAKVASAA